LMLLVHFWTLLRHGGLVKSLGCPFFIQIGTASIGMQMFPHHSSIHAHAQDSARKRCTWSTTALPKNSLSCHRYPDPWLFSMEQHLLHLT
jgi:hypothetical protein